MSLENKIKGMQSNFASVLKDVHSIIGDVKKTLTPKELELFERTQKRAIELGKNNDLSGLEQLKKNFNE